MILTLNTIFQDKGKYKYHFLYSKSNTYLITHKQKKHAGEEHAAGCSCDKGPCRLLKWLLPGGRWGESLVLLGHSGRHFIFWMRKQFLSM